jgi:hypothetical protein
MATELKFAALRPLFIAIAMFVFVAAAAFAWAAVESQSAGAESKIVALP